MLIGLVPALAPEARTRPSTSTWSLPVADSVPSPEASIHGMPPPLSPRSGTTDWAPVRPAGTPTITSHLMSLGPLGVAASAWLATSKATIAPMASRIKRLKFIDQSPSARATGVAHLVFGRQEIRLLAGRGSGSLSAGSVSTRGRARWDRHGGTRFRYAVEIVPTKRNHPVHRLPGVAR